MKLLNEQQVKEITGLSRVTRWRLERDRRFPARVKLTSHRVGWREDEIQEWVESRPRVDAGEVRPPLEGSE